MHVARFVGRSGALALLCIGALVAMPSCSDDEPEGVCSLSDNAGCEPGQQCRVGADGTSACFCSPEANSGCPNGQLCMNDPGGNPACYCGPDSDAGCENQPGTVCEEVPGGYPACFPPVTLGGMVFDLATTDPIEGAHVVARDANFAAVSGVAVTDPAGAYELVVPVPRKADGSLLEFQVFLRADAAGYQTFPTAPRVSLPIDMSMASGDPLHLETSTSNIGMIALESTMGLGSVSGTVVADFPVGTLVVAGGETVQGGGVTGIADTDGSYTVFNVPVGSVAVRGYKIGLQLDGATADVAAGAETTGVDLLQTGAAVAVLDGKVEIVNPGMGEDTSVIFVVDETFVENAARGEAPPGLRAYPVDGAFQIDGVPDGNYVVLAAFENDFLVRDPDTCIGGTEIVRITVAGASMTIDESFKVTGALDVISPDDEEPVSGEPTLKWVDDSSEKSYQIRVYDAFGTLVAQKLDVPSVSGGGEVSVPYGDLVAADGMSPAPALEPGLLYQFRATSISQNDCELSITEDLTGVWLQE
jgi:hypothetical protein